MKEEIKKRMLFRSKDKIIKPLKIFMPSGNIILAVYRGSFSKYDILLRYRQIGKKEKLSRIRTPKHIHWAVDILTKMHKSKRKIKSFLDFLIEIWNQTTPIKSAKERKKILDAKNLLKAHKDKIEEYKSLSNFGEYNIEFLILLAKLLMIQEKTNRPDAYMFRKLLEALKKGEDVFSIVSKATYGRKK